jgi:hypothetical protein
MPPPPHFVRGRIYLMARGRRFARRREFAARQTRTTDLAMRRIRVLLHDAKRIRLHISSRGGEAPKGANQPLAAPHQTGVAACRCPGAAARSFGARSPSGASPRHSPGRTHPALAQLQFPRFLRPGFAGVTRCRLSLVYRAPRRPVVMPAERWPGAARERFAKPPAGTAPAPHFGSHPECVPRSSRLGRDVTMPVTHVTIGSRSQ